VLLEIGMRILWTVFVVKCSLHHRLREVERDEATKRRREEARNSLEGYLYRVRDLLSDPNSDTPFMKCSQEEERKSLSEKVEETMSWLHDRGDLAETSQLYDKRNAVEYAALARSRNMALTENLRLGSSRDPLFTDIKK
jgi:hypothetical protein